MSTKENTAVRLDEATRKRVETVRAEITTEWHKASFSDALRAVIVTGLNTLEQSRARGEKPS